MFVVVLYGHPEYHEELISVEGIVYNENDFNRYIDEKFPGQREKWTREENFYGHLSISYDILGSINPSSISMEKVNEIGQPK